MGLLRLLFKLDADASGLRSKLHAAERDMTGFARRSARDFRTVFTTFFSISAMRNMVRSVFQFAEKYATDSKFKEKVQELGTTLDDVTVNSVMAMSLRFQALGYQIMSAAIPALDAMGKAVWGIVGWVRKSAAALGVISTFPVGRRAGEAFMDAHNNAPFPMNLMKWGGVGWMHKLLSAGKGAGGVLSSDEMWNQVNAEIAKVDAEMAEAAEMAERRVKKEIEMLRKKDTTSVTTPAEAATAQTKRDQLAAIGGFTSRADMEIQSLSKRQLRELEKISGNTDGLKVGIGGS